MSDSVETVHPAGTEGLAAFVHAGVLRAAEVHVAGAIARSVPGTSDAVLLAAALCVRALQQGHVCVVIDDVATAIAVEPSPDTDHDGTVDEHRALLDDLAWPAPAAWRDELVASPAVVIRDPRSGEVVDGDEPDELAPLVFDGQRVYLERYWRYERQVGTALLADLTSTTSVTFDDRAIDAVLDRYFGTTAGSGDLQRQGAETALRRRVTVLAGGPGTGKTHTVARLLAALHQLSHDAGRPLEIALAAPTGKAATRMTEAVRQAIERADVPEPVARPLLETEALTIHRLLGYRDGITFRHDRTDPLPHDVVVIDETSMVALPLMARLLDAVRPDARLVLVGDPFQLASVEAGVVLGDIVGPAARSHEPDEGPLADAIVVLQQARRFSADSPIAALADAVKAEDADRAIEVLTDPDATGVTWIQPSEAEAVEELRREVAAAAAGVARAARAGDAGVALELATQLKVLCGTRFGPLGSYAWSDDIERRLRRLIPQMRTSETWYPGRPIIVTRNDYVTGVFNGDTGLVVPDEGAVAVAMQVGSDLRRVPTTQFERVETWWAMTVHKSQGSEFSHAVVSLPAASSQVLTNELLYTGITRGRERVTVLATEDSLRAAIDRRIARASGLQARLWA